MFTIGRDLSTFIDNNEREGIQEPVIYYSIWGAVYGAASLPKTLTEVVTQQHENMEVLLAAFRTAHAKFAATFHDGDSGEEEAVSQEPGLQRHGNASTQSLSPVTSDKGKEILYLVNERKRIKLSEIKRNTRGFGSINEIEELIKSELHQKIMLEQKGRVKWALAKTTNLFN